MGKARKAGTLGLAIIAAMTMLFAAFLLALPLTTAWDDDACVAHGDGRAPLSQERSVWPPGSRCTYAAPDGETTQAFVDPGPWEPLKWPVLLLLAGAPVTLAAGLIASIHDLRSGAGPQPPRRVGGIAT